MKAEYYYKDKLASDETYWPCFSFLRDTDCDLVKYYPRITIAEKYVDFWLNCLTEWGFEFEYNKTDSYFKVSGDNYYRKTINLIFLRYLDTNESSVSEVVALLYKLHQENPLIDKWQLFHAAHYIIYNQFYFNVNHTLLDHSTRKIISLADFWANVEGLSKLKFYGGVFSDALGNDRVVSQEINNAIKKKDALSLIKLLC